MSELRQQNVIIILLVIRILCGASCQRKQNAVSKEHSTLAPQFANFYGSKKSFHELFTELKQIPLSNDPGFYLSAMPILSAVNQKGDFVILDNFSVRKILVFDHKGQSKAKIGNEGRGLGQYLFPDNMFYQSHTRKYYVYDGDLLRILEYNEDFRFSFSFSIPLFLESLLVTDDNRIFCYTSGAANKRGVDKVIYECNRSGKIIKSFAEQSKNYCVAAESKGGGIVLLNQHLYVITPYEYTLRKYDLNGKLIKIAQFKSLHYLPPPKGFDDIRALNDLRRRQEFHASWSHIRQILKIGDKMIGVVFAEPGEARVFLDIYDTGLNRITGDILLPEYVGGPRGFFTQGDCLFLLRPAKPKSHNQITNPTVVVYLLKCPANFDP